MSYLTDILYLKPFIAATRLPRRSDPNHFPISLRIFRARFLRELFRFEGFDSGVNSPSIYLNSSHCSIVFAISNL
jgi:hypothetical protein